MEEREFVEGSKDGWDRLAAHVEATRGKGVAALDVAALRSMHEEYRRAAADLAYAQTHYPGGRTESYLNRLVAQAHAELYGSSPRRLAQLWRFLSVGYPRLVRESWRPMALSAALFIGMGAIGFLLAYVNYPLARLLIPAAFRDGIGDTFEQGRTPDELIAAIAPLLSAGITVNNIQVALLAMAGGMTFGVLTAYAMVTNGAMLGVLAGVFAKAGHSLEFWSFILPHGSLELPAIVVAGAAGFTIAGGIVTPGDLPRGAALAAAANKAARLVLGCVPLFVVAGLIEGFVTPRDFDPVLKVVFGVAMMALLGAYLLGAGRKRV
jgi:uncharacterized membrane protein SpoIIM required for sporulation